MIGFPLDHGLFIAEVADDRKQDRRRSGPVARIPLPDVLDSLRACEINSRPDFIVAVKYSFLIECIIISFRIIIP